MSAVTASAKKSPPDLGCFAQWCHMTGWHGILDFYIAKNFVWKIVWLFVVLGGCLLAINQSFCMITDFLSDDQWVTSTSYELPKQRLEWPNMTICTLNWPPIKKFMHSQESEIEEAKQITSNYQQADLASLLMRAPSGNTTISKQSQLPINTTISRPQNPIDAAMSKNCLNIIIQCGTQWNELPFDQRSRETCCAQSDETDASLSCFNIKPNVFGTEHQTHGSRAYYLLDGNPKIPEQYLDGSSGFEIFLYLGDSHPNDDFSSSFHVMPGTRNVISMIMEERRTVVKTRSFRFSGFDLPCNKTFQYLNTQEYSKELCALDCMIMWQVRFFKCYSLGEFKDEHLVEIKNANKCDDKIANECAWEYFFLSRANPSADSSFAVDERMDAAQCVNQCPEPCVYRRVEAKISSSLFLPQNKISKMRSLINEALEPSVYETKNRYNYNEKELRQLTMVELRYEMKQQRVVEKIPRLSMDELISNIGGCLGVWSGISFLSIFQVVCYIFQGVGHCLRKLCCKFKLRKNSISDTGKPVFEKSSTMIIEKELNTVSNTV